MCFLYRSSRRRRELPSTDSWPVTTTQFTKWSHLILRVINVGVQMRMQAPQQGGQVSCEQGLTDATWSESPEALVHIMSLQRQSQGRQTTLKCRAVLEESLRVEPLYPLHGRIQNRIGHALEEGVRDVDVYVLSRPSFHMTCQTPLVESDTGCSWSRRIAK